MKKKTKKDGPEIVPFQSPYYAFESTTQSVVLDCVVKSNPSVLALEWFKDKYLLSNTNKYQILANNSLLIRHVRKSDRGNYYCVCNNTHKKSVSPLIKLEILDAKTTEMAAVYNALAHESIRLPCAAAADDSTIADLKWFKINSALARARYDIDSNGSLVMNNLKPRDAGYFMCMSSSNNQDEDVRRPLFGERLIKLNVIVQHNRSSSPNFGSFESPNFETDANDIIGKSTSLNNNKKKTTNKTNLN